MRMSLSGRDEWKNSRRNDIIEALTGRLPRGRIPVGGEESLRLRDRDRVKYGSMREVVLYSQLTSYCTYT